MSPQKNWSQQAMCCSVTKTCPKDIFWLTKDVHSRDILVIQTCAFLFNKNGVYY